MQANRRRIAAAMAVVLIAMLAAVACVVATAFAQGAAVP